jgi:hypothetical protein
VESDLRLGVIVKFTILPPEVSGLYASGGTCGVTEGCLERPGFACDTISLR